MDLYNSELLSGNHPTLPATEEIAGFRVRPGMFDVNGAMALSFGVNFTIQTHYGTNVELLLFRPAAKEPYAVLPFPESCRIGDVYSIPVSHGEGKFVVSEDLARELFANGQVAFQYVDPLTDEPTMESPYNPNGSYYAIEGIISKNGQILGKMGHSERYENNLLRNIQADLEQPLFANAVNYFKK